MSDNGIYLLIKCIKSVLWRVAKRLSYIEDARCLTAKRAENYAESCWGCSAIESQLLLLELKIRYPKRMHFELVYWPILPYEPCVRWTVSSVESSWNVMAHGDVREEKWRGNMRMEWVTGKRHMTAEHRLVRAVQTLQADVHSSPASSRLNWRPRRFKWTRPFRRKTKSGFCACAITFNKQSASHQILFGCSNEGGWGAGGHMSCVEEKRNVYRVKLGKLEDLGVNWRIILI